MGELVAFHTLIKPWIDQNVNTYGSKHWYDWVSARRYYGDLGGPGGGTWGIKGLKALVLQGLRAFLVDTEAPGGGKAGGRGDLGGGGSALNKRSPTVITILKHPRKMYYHDR